MDDKQPVMMLRRNWNCDYMYDVINGRGFTITEPSEFEMGKKKINSIHGARSPLYGTDFSDEQSCIEKYRCECGIIKGLQFEHEICPYCNTEVTYKDIDIEYTGWLSLGDNYIVAPYYYMKLSDIIGAKIFDDIVTAKRKVDRDGHISVAKSEDMNEEPLSPFSGIGVTEFRIKFDDVMAYFREKKKKSEKKVKAIDRLLDEKGSIFVSKIPVYSKFLRPQSRTSESFFFNSIDKEIEPLYNLCEKIKICEDIEKYFVLSRIQTRVNKLWHKNLETISGKPGFIRKQILGGGLNYTSRNVIIPEQSLELDEVVLSYHAFRILFKDKILYYLIKSCDMTLSAAIQKWNEGHSFNNQIYEIMCAILANEKPKILINRNPTLNYYSMLLMKIKMISSNPDDYTMGIPLYILPGLNADFDGDILNIIAMVNKSMEKIFDKFSPVKHMIIDRVTGKINPYFSISKNQMVDLHLFSTV